MLLRLDVFSLRTLSSLVEENIVFPQGDIGRKRRQEWVRSQEMKWGEWANIKKWFNGSTARAKVSIGGLGVVANGVYLGSIKFG
jgi:hypothetical protein